MTAYEVRISDWSSDVCSSDLAEHDRHSQTRTLSDRLGREERFEHMLQRRLVHAATVITNRDFDEVIALARTQRDRAGALDRLSGIVEDRSDERRVGNEGGSKCRARWAPNR